MYATIIIYLAVSSAVAIATLCYIGADVIVESKKGKGSPGNIPTQTLTPAPAPIPAPESPTVTEPIVLPRPVASINAEEAEVMISGTLAMSAVRYDSGAGHGKQGIVNLGDINNAFEPHELVTLEALKKKGLIPKHVGRTKILADGILTKPLTVKAESYSLQAIKMIELTGGTVIILKD